MNARKPRPPNKIISPFARHSLPTIPTTCGLGSKTRPAREGRRKGYLLPSWGRVSKAKHDKGSSAIINKNEEFLPLYWACLSQTDRGHQHIEWASRKNRHKFSPCQAKLGLCSILLQRNTKKWNAWAPLPPLKWQGLRLISEERLAHGKEARNVVMFNISYLFFPVNTFREVPSQWVHHHLLFDHLSG